MARISLLFTLAFVLVIGSVSAHPPSHKKTHKNLCPTTLSKLQSFPRAEILKFLDKNVKSESMSIQYKSLLAFILAYTDNLGNFGFDRQPIKTKYDLVSQAMLKAQAFVGVEGKLAVKLTKSYSAMAKGFVQIVDKMVEISTKYKFEANAKISKKDQADVEKCLIKLKGSIRVYLKVISACTKKFSAEKKLNLPGSFIGDFANKGLGFGGKVVGLGGKVGGKVRDHAKAKIGAHAGAKIGAHAGGKIGAKGGAKFGIGGANVGAQGEGKVGGIFKGFLGFGGKVQYDASGKPKVGGGNGFKSLKHPHTKHLD